MERVPIVVFVSGSGSNCEAILAAADAGHCAAQVVAVVSDQPDAFGLVRAARRGVPTFGIPPTKTQERATHERAILAAVSPMGHASRCWRATCGW